MPSTTTEKPTTAVELVRDGHVATLTLTTPAGVNILSSPTLGELKVHVERLASDSTVRFVVFRGAGKVFAAGADIAAMRTFDEHQGKAYSTNGHHIFDAIEAMPQVTFAAIAGAALGGGCELAMACDFRLATANAKLGQPESRLGLIPGWGGTIRLPRLIGLSQARRLMFTGESVTADEALKLGLVDEVFADAAALETGLKSWMTKMLPGSPEAIRRIKHAVSKHDEIAQFGRCFSCEDAKDGMAAFLEKRSPSWVG
ncbi:MAG: enoyl-CoA hydratase/isomerase family protein [Phycisphaerae bacterium]